MIADRVSSNARIAGATYRTMLATAAQYRAYLVAYLLIAVLQSLVYLVVWSAVADGSGGSVDGYDSAAFATYFTAAMVVRELTTPGISSEFPRLVQTGELSPMLLRPAHPLVDLWGRAAGMRTQRLMLLLPVVALTIAGFGVRLAFDPAALLGFALVLPMAIVTRYLVDSLLALLSFWLVDIRGIRGIYFLLLLMVSGQFMPLAIMPSWMQALARALPFYWTFGFPIELVTGRAEPAGVIAGFAILVGWTTAIGFALHLTWRRGVRCYGAAGA